LIFAVVLGFAPIRTFADVAYKLGVSDLIDIRVLGESEFTGAFRVGTDGTIDYPFLRKVAAEGKTTEELAGEITKLLKNGYLTNPQVTVDVKEYRSQSVTVLGAVGKPGSYVLQEETRILDVISKAGGISAGGGKRVLLIRKPLPAGEAPKENTPEESKPIVIDYYKIAHEGNMAQNLVLRNGDVLNVPKGNEVYVVGSVARPGPIPFEENMAILQAVTLAGGTTNVASPKSTYVLRQSEKGEEKIQVRLDKILENKTKNFILRADDVIVVPESFF
jgi:polysaccharide biosynthesis/export protein